MDTPFRDKIDKTTSWSSKKGVWEWSGMRDLGKSTSDTWEQVIADNHGAESMRDLEIRMIKPQHDSYWKKDYQIQVKGEVVTWDRLGWAAERLRRFRTGSMERNMALIGFVQLDTK
jgi:hypothetical protein